MILIHVARDMITPETRAMHAGWGKAVRRRRRELELSQAALAEAVGISHQGIFRIEAGENGPTDETRIKIAQALGLRVEDLFAYPDTTATSEQEASA